MGTRAGTEERVRPEVVGPLGMGLELHTGVQGAYDNYSLPTVTHSLDDTVRGPAIIPYKRWKASESTHDKAKVLLTPHRQKQAQSKGGSDHLEGGGLNRT